MGIEDSWWFNSSEVLDRHKLSEFILNACSVCARGTAHCFTYSIGNKFHQYVKPSGYESPLDYVCQDCYWSFFEEYGDPAVFAYGAMYVKQFSFGEYIKMLKGEG